MGAIEEREAKVDAYLTKMSSGSNPRLNSSVAFAGKAAWKQILQSLGPEMIWCDAYINEDGELFFSWKKDRRNLELRITQGQPAEIGFCDLGSDSDDCDWQELWFIGEPLPVKVLAVTHFFAKQEPPAHV